MSLKDLTSTSSAPNMDKNGNIGAGGSPSSGQTSMVDLNKIVKRWAWDRFLADRSWKQRNLNPLKYNQIDFEIDWSKVIFKHSEPVNTPEDPTKPPPPQVKILFKTQFENNTENDQNYSFKTERTTSSTCSVEVEKGVMMGYETSLTLKTPCEVLEANAGFKREVTVNSTDCEEVVDDVMWGVDSQIKVKANHKTTAQLVVDEVSKNKRYTINTRAYGIVKVNLRKKKNSKHITHIGGDIVSIIDRTADDKEKRMLKIDRTTKELPVVTYETKCKALFSFGAEQRVDLKEEPTSPTS